ncbi:HpcH/HpaI aldolase/citrate lyase family protein [Hoeflea sp. G2-23]|uniref:HpcH/HpaI aldolase/citrate lyase family protein n=1 Tax=Hoeflea algicola TaxID=2983763 RepID=A0ABT3ZDU7_9HYPH|nr:HpcH/HpaI aldolase/citrate lyase family protein [Hoeflea algicola]MCY0149823.1 HpcH/HpaI aldolase/citrate lyase family protein [Hoeflea algicola]
MEIRRNRFKRALEKRIPQIGMWTNLGSDFIAEIIADAEFDWILLDMEHAPNEIGDVLRQLQAVDCRHTAPIVRPPWNDPVILKRLLDLGFQSFLIPFVQNHHEAELAVKATRYPPLGNRGVAGSMRASRFGRVKNYTQEAADEICVLVQVETREALDNLEDIAATEGVDGVFIGPSDLAASVGYLGRPDHPDMKALISEAIRRINSAGKVAGILAPIPSDAHRWLDEGAMFVSVGVDANMVVRSTAELRAQFPASSA